MVGCMERDVAGRGCLERDGGEALRKTVSGGEGRPCLHEINGYVDLKLTLYFRIKAGWFAGTYVGDDFQACRGG